MPPRIDITVGNPPYAQALVRPVSPGSSIGTRPPNDTTPLEDWELSQEDFDKRCWANLKVDEATEQEAQAMSWPLYYAYHKMSPEEMAASMSNLDELHEEIQKLHDNELFEQALLRGSQVGLDFQTPTGDIDKIMSSMLEPSEHHQLIPNAGECIGPSIMTNQPSFYVPERELDLSQITVGTIDTRHASKGKRKA